MEAAGLVLGAVSVVLYAFDNYERCLSQVKDYWKYQSTLQTIRTHVFIQGEQLNVTLSGIGLTRPTRQELEEHLTEIYTKGKCDEFMAIIDRMEALLAKMMASLDVDSSGKPRWTDTAPERANWEWRRVKRSFRRKERQAFIDELRYWNECLKNVFEKTEIPSDESDQLSERLQARYNQRECDRIRENVRLVHKALQSVGWTCHCAEHWGSIRLCWHMEKIITSEKLDFCFSSCQSSMSWKSIHIRVEEKDKLNTQSPGSQRSISPGVSPQISHTSLPRRQKFKEILGLSKQAPECLLTPDTAVTATSSAETLVSQEITCMCQFINNFQDGKRGVVQLSDDDKRLVILENVDNAKKATKTAVHLETLLRPKTNPVRPSHLVLSRKQRLAIAAASSWAVLYLCGSPWLNDDWDGKNHLQLFLEEAQGTGPASLQADYPSISQLFKPISQGLSSEPMNPVTDFQNCQIRNKTLFSLGILLIELCLNKTLDQLRRELQANDFAASLDVLSPEPSDFEVANRLTEDIYLEAGHSYGYAVQRCLRCEFPGRDVTKDFKFQPFRRHFFNGVVAPIQATFEMQPASLLNH
ncbi:uncharacterized protein B0J16DRAFT_183258 [Fusarium flagelliforme]|uniref:DUF7580 domain-containing protein n=1 Tax=Fusarium flagelliforme TaxID=2675880 RepID=A0A395MKA0_9HYPO|nr:uncharacterized protein B0J16DRAFT_183258 [Fusarium flagelliforme]KAH7174587.1 hypothetical protein B0J16DRAFT_183258 [Fusarium flagelliforme]RFN48378.1 hypothetical protein FIE12Z_7427 [Fusarium flagelliforme]